MKERDKKKKIIIDLMSVTGRKKKKKKKKKKSIIDAGWKKDNQQQSLSAQSNQTMKSIKIMVEFSAREHHDREAIATIPSFDTMIRK